MIQNSINISSSVLSKLVKQFSDTSKITQSILHIIKEDPPAVTKNGGYIREGVASKLDELRHISSDVSKWMADMQVQERESNNIPSLKIGYNRVFGYYLEVTKAHVEKVPDHYIRKQTLTNSERYFTEELKEYEETRWRRGPFSVCYRRSLKNKALMYQF